jgi:hypothetical protein
MAATARANPKNPKAIGGRPPRPPVPPEDDLDDGELISLGPPAEDEEPEPARVPLFEFKGTVYTMLAEPPPTIGLETLRVSERKGGLGFGEIHLMRVMMGDAGLDALLEAGRIGWLKPAQFNTILAKVRNAALAALEEDPNP